jgi:4-amino-4-deoxy-L-arabinose transferase-like glycosyltransferase
MSVENDRRAAAERLPPLSLHVLALLAVAKLLLHLPGLWRHGYFRDELYFLDCGRHLAFGYVDHAPLIGLYAKLALLLGGSLPALRVLPVLAGVGTVVLTALICRELGGGRFAQGLAGLALLVAPVHLMVASILSMNAFEPLYWMGGALVVARIVRTGDSRLWPVFGLLAGLGLENKHSTLFFGLGVAVAVLATPLRRELAKPWIWIGAAVAAALFLPNLVWQWRHGFPTLEDLANVRSSGKNVALAPLSFLAEQALMMHPITLPVWLAGLWSLLVGAGKRYRALGLVFLVLLLSMMALHGKSYYLAPAYPMLLAAGGVAIERRLAAIVSTRRSLLARAAAVAVVAVAGAVTAPTALPLLDPEGFVAYQAALGLAPGKTEVAHEGPLPQLWGDQFGWPELVADVAGVYRSLPPDERARAAVFASNYGEAGAINLLGPALGLPPAVCAHQTYFFWGPPERDPEVIIWLQWPRESLERLCGSVEQVAEHHHPWGMAEENRPIFICRDPITPLSELWPQLKQWN